ncbi:MAG: cation-translocating P-type ATPase [Pirellulales bacterium]
MSAESQSRQFRIHGMDCAEEVTVLKRAIGPLVGGESSLSFDVLNGKMTIAAGPTVVSTADVLHAVARTGMQAELWADRVVQPETSGTWEWWGKTILTALSASSIVVGILLEIVSAGGLQAAFVLKTDGAPWQAKVFYGLAALAGAWSVIPKAWYAARRLQPDMNLLMTVAVAGAIAIGEWFEAAAVAFLFSLSLLLESWSVGRARRAVAALMQIAPPMARVLRENGSTEEIAPDQVSVGATLVVKPGEKIPLDGRVKEGESDVNQAPITGESQPVIKKPGDDVFAGTINGDGALQIESTKPSTDTTLAKIIRMISAAQSRRGPSEQWVEKFARIYTPVVMLLAAVVFLIPTLAFGRDISIWFYRALVLLVIACPCALVISTPVSIVAGLTAAARQGVLIKGGVYLEAPAYLNAIALDKTGTLTAGRPQVVEIVPLSGHDERELIERAAGMEQHSEHPIARAVLDYAAAHDITPSKTANFQVIKGKGATATFGDREFWLGSHRYLEERGQETDEIHQRLESMSGLGRTVVVVGHDQHVCGLIALADEVRPGIRKTLDDLRAAGIKHLIMLTGDNRPTAEAIAKETGVDEFLAELLPEDKVAAVEALVSKYERVAMVGDGVNDAPALARATIGIAMGSAGTDAAIETADIALMSDDLTRLPWLIRHSRRTLTIIRQNIAFSLAVKALFVVLTLIGISSLWGAIAADTGASLLVIFNGLRLLAITKAEE